MSDAPMEVARRYVSLTRQKRNLDSELRSLKESLDVVESELLELIENEQIPASFTLDGARVFTREQLWASPKDGDHGALAHVLNQLGLREYLPRTVNSHSISAYVREHIDAETGEIVGLAPELEAQLKITRQVKAVVNG